MALSKRQMASSKQLAYVRNLLIKNKLFMRFKTYHQKYGLTWVDAQVLIKAMTGRATREEIKRFKVLTTPNRWEMVINDDELPVDKPLSEKDLPMAYHEEVKSPTALTKAAKQWHDRNLLEQKQLYGG